MRPNQESYRIRRVADSMKSKQLLFSMNCSPTDVLTVSGLRQTNSSLVDAHLGRTKVHPPREQDHRRHGRRHEALRPHQGRRQSQALEIGHRAS